jgi:hypothetical protein
MESEAVASSMDASHRRRHFTFPNKSAFARPGRLRAFDSHSRFKTDRKVLPFSQNDWPGHQSDLYPDTDQANVQYPLAPRSKRGSPIFTMIQDGIFMGPMPSTILHGTIMGYEPRNEESVKYVLQMLARTPTAILMGLPVNFQDVSGSKPDPRFDLDWYRCH